MVIVLGVRDSVEGEGEEEGEEVVVVVDDDDNDVESRLYSLRVGHVVVDDGWCSSVGCMWMAADLVT